MASRTEVLLWAQRVVAKKNGPPHLVLDLNEGATVQDAQEAFHKIARAAHPDLHRNLGANELELVTSAYAAVAGAYMQMRSQSMQTASMRPLRPDEVAAPAAAPAPAPAPAHRPTPLPAPSGRTPPAGVRAAAMAGGDAVPGNPASSMSSKAIIYYRKAELALKRGDFKSAVLQIKLAIAADPTSGFLRNALAEIDAELRKGT